MQMKIRRSWSSLAALICLLLVTVGPGVAAAFEVVVESVEVGSDPVVPVTSYFDVYVRAEVGELDPPDIAAWQVSVDLDDPGLGLEFTGAELPTAPHAPLISDNFNENMLGEDDDARRTATAIEDPPFTAVPFVEDAGFVRVNFEVAPGTDDTFAVSLDLDPVEGTTVTDGYGAPLPFVAVNGIITVPEPEASPLMAAGILSLWGLTGLHRRRLRRTAGSCR